MDTLDSGHFNVRRRAGARDPSDQGRRLRTAIKATQTGNSTYAAAPTVTQSFTIDREAQTITFAAIPSQTVGTPLTLSATASSGLAVTFSSITGSRCTISGSTATFIEAGTCTIYAVQTGSANYSAAPEVSQSFTVNPN